MNYDTYDKEQVHDEQIAPLVDQILAICTEHKIPVLLCFQYAAYASGKVGMCSSAVADAGQGCDAFIRALHALDIPGAG